MRKLIPIILTLLLTACQSKTETFQKTCQTKIKTTDIIITEKTKITYNNLDQITKAVITKQYKAINKEGKTTINNIKKSAQDYNNETAKSKAIKIREKSSKEKYIVKYYLNVRKMNNQELEEFELSKNSIKYFNKNKNCK